MREESGAARDLKPARHVDVARRLLVCGVLASAFYVAMDIFVAARYPGYSVLARQESELSAIGAPTRPLWIAMSAVYAPLMIAFGVAVWRCAAVRQSLHAAGALLVAFAIIGEAWALFAPMHPVGHAQTTTDTMHVVFAGIQIVVMVLFMSFGAAALGGRFRWFSMVMVAAMLAAGGFVGTQAQAVAAGRAGPLLGLVERVSIFAPMVWIGVFSVRIWREARPV